MSNKLFDVSTMVVMTGRESGESMPDERDREPKEESERREKTTIAILGGKKDRQVIEGNQNNKSDKKRMVKENKENNRKIDNHISLNKDE